MDDYKALSDTDGIVADKSDSSLKVGKTADGSVYATVV